MGSFAEAGRQALALSDDELLKTIGDDLRSFYADIVRQPLPANIEAALARIDHAQTHAGNLSRPSVRWTVPSFGN